MAQSFTVDGYVFSFSNSGAVNLDGPGVHASLGYPPLTSRSFTSLLTSPSVENTPGAADALNLLASQVDSINQLIVNAQRPITNEAPASSGEIATDQQAAKDDGANTQDPQPPATALTLDGRIVPTDQLQKLNIDNSPGTASISTNLNTTVVNGQTIPASAVAGLSEPLISISQSQSTPPIGTIAIDGQSIVAVPGVVTGTAGADPTTAKDLVGTALRSTVQSSPGAGSGTGVNNAANTNDDNIGNTNGTPLVNTQQILTQTFTGQIPTQKNQLDQYASYTYALSWYLLTPNQYTTFIAGQKNLSQWSLLMQSGGASPTPTVSSTVGGDSFPTVNTSGRSQSFPYDYYMDDLEITTLIPLGGTGLCHSATDIRFKVVEPNGISLINNLYAAVNTLYKQPQPSTSGPTNNTNATTSIQNPNYPMAHYCMVIHFYGYDQQGNLVAPAVGSYSPNGVPAKNDPKAVIEKYYPFVIANLKYRMANKQIEYEVTGKPQAHFYNIGTDRGSIPFNFNIAGSTVGQMLVGTPVTTQTNTADPGARVTQTKPTNLTGTSPAAASVLQDITPAVTNGVDTTTGINFSF